MPYDLDGLVKVGLDVLNTTVNKVTGKILAQLGSVVERKTDADNVEWWQHVSWASRPSKPEAGKKAAQAVVLSMSDHDVAIASQDVRSLDMYGNLDFGEFCAYAPGEDGNAQARLIGKKDGSIALFTTDDNTKAGKSIFFRVSKDGFLFAAPFGTMKFDKTGFHVNVAGVATIDMGVVGGLPPPLDVIGSYIKMQAGTVSASCSGMPLADATSTIAAIAALQTQIAGLAAGFAKLALVVGPVQGTDAVAASAIVAPIVAVGATAVGVQTVLIPKGSGMT